MQAPSVDQLTTTLRHLNFTIFDSPKTYDLNIVGIRSSRTEANSFNDLICAFYRAGDIWAYFAFPATTDPGHFYRSNPCNVEGTAILVPGQYRQAFSLGTHRDYEALVQCAPLRIYRDNNRDTILDTSGMSPLTAYQSINIHRASPTLASKRVDKWSAGCQVLQDPIHFLFFMNLCRKSARIFGPKFTYTLIDESSLMA